VDERRDVNMLRAMIRVININIFIYLTRGILWVFVTLHQVDERRDVNMLRAMSRVININIFICLIYSYVRHEASYGCSAPCTKWMKDAMKRNYTSNGFVICMNESRHTYENIT